MPTPGSYAHGPWRLTKPDWCSPWIATHTDTEEVRDTGCTNLNDAIDTLTDPDPKATQPTLYTIAAGPQRARCGHQRFPGTGFLEHADPHAKE